MCEQVDGGQPILCFRAYRRHIEPIPEHQIAVEETRAVAALYARKVIAGDCSGVAYYGICAADLGPGELKDAITDRLALDPDMKDRPYLAVLQILNTTVRLQEDYVDGWRKFWSCDIEGFANLREDLRRIGRLTLKLYLRMVLRSWIDTLHWWGYQVSFLDRVKALQFTGSATHLQPGRWFWQHMRTEAESQARFEKYTKEVEDRMYEERMKKGNQ